MTPDQLEGRRHAAHAAADAQLAVQPDRGGLHAGRTGGAGRRGPGTEAGVLSDEIYEQLIFGDAKPTCFATLRPGLRERTITISGASKSYAMTGWRMGWAIAPAAVISAMGNMQSQETGCPRASANMLCSPHWRGRKSV